MISGTVNDALERIVQIGLVRGGQTSFIPAVVDTGFSGELCLSEQRLDAMDLEFRYVDRYELADGTIVAKDVFGGQATFDGHPRDVDVILTDSADTLIGGSLMKHHALTVDYPKRSVRLEQSSAP